MATDINWPNLPVAEPLPNPLRSNYGYQGRDACVSVTFGPTTLVRQVFSDVPADLNQIGWFFTPEQWAIFEAFFVYELKHGQLYFNLPLQLAGRDVEMVEASFQGRMPRFGLVGVNHCNTTGQITTRSGTQMSLGAWTLIKNYGSAEASLSFLNRLEVFANEDLPNNLG